MDFPAYRNGGGFTPPQPPFNLFASVLDAVTALPQRLNKVVWNLHNRYGVPLDIAIGNVLGVLSFVCQGVSNALDSKGDPMPQSAIVHVVGVPFSGKSVSLLRLMESVEKAMADWPHQWEFEDSTPQGIKRVAPVLGLCAHEEGDAFFQTALGRDLALQVSLRDGRIPVVTRAKRQDGDRKKKGVTRFTTIVLIQPDIYDEWLNRNRKKAVGSGFLQRVWMVRSYMKSDKSAIGRYPLSEGGLDDWDQRVSELLEIAKKNGNSGFANLSATEIAGDASYVLNQAQQRIDFLDAQGVFRHEASAVAARYHERVSVLAEMFHRYEGEGHVVNRSTMLAATVVADYLLGQWLSIVFPPPPMCQDELDAGVLLPLLRTELRGRGVAGIRASEVVTLAKNIKWMPQRTKAALMALYATGQLMLVPRTIHGRNVEMVELPANMMIREAAIAGHFGAQRLATVFAPKPMPDAEQHGWRLLECFCDSVRRTEGKVSSWREPDILVQAPNFGWSGSQMKAAIAWVCGHGFARVLPRIENDRRVVWLELNLNHIAFQQTNQIDLPKYV
jgi:hypothetical protein